MLTGSSTGRLQYAYWLLYFIDCLPVRHESPRRARGVATGAPGTPRAAARQLLLGEMAGHGSAEDPRSNSVAGTAQDPPPMFKERGNMHACALPHILTAGELLEKGFVMGYVPQIVGEPLDPTSQPVQDSYAKKFCILPRVYWETVIDPTHIISATRIAFPTVEKFDCDLGGWMTPLAEQFLTPYQGGPDWDPVVDNHVGTNLVYIPPTYNNLYTSKHKNGKFTMTELITRAIRTIETNPDRTLTLVIPASSNFACSETYLRTEQRFLINSCLPYLRAVVGLKGDVLERQWRLGRDAEFYHERPSISTKKYMVLCLKGPKSGVNEQHRNEIILRDIVLPQPLLPGPLITIPTPPMKCISVEACWDSARFGTDHDSGMLETLLWSGNKLKVKKGTDGEHGVKWEGSSLKVSSIAHASVLHQVDGSSLVGQIVSQVNARDIETQEDFQAAWEAATDVEITTATPLLEHRHAIYEVQMKASRPGASRFELNVPAALARDLVNAMNSRETRVSFAEVGVEVYTWVDEDLHSTAACALSAPSDGSVHRPGVIAARVLAILSEASGVKLSLAPGRWYATQRDALPRSRFFQLIGLTPIEVARYLSRPEVSKEVGGMNVSMYDHAGVALRTGGNSVTMLIPKGMPVETVVEAVAKSHNLTSTNIFHMASRDPSVQRVRVLFAPGDHTHCLGTNVAVRCGEHGIRRVVVFQPQRRSTADAMSVASSGDREEKRVLSVDECARISQEVLATVMESELFEGPHAEAAAEVASQPTDQQRSDAQGQPAQDSPMSAVGEAHQPRAPRTGGTKSPGRTRAEAALRDSGLGGFIGKDLRTPPAKEKSVDRDEVRSRDGRRTASRSLNR